MFYPQIQMITYMKFILYFFSFYICFNTITVQSQNNLKIDSLQKLLGNQDDVVKINTLHELAWELQYKKDSSGILYALEELRLSKQLKNHEAEVNALNILGKIAKQQQYLGDAEAYFLEAIKVAKTYEYKHGIARGYNELGLFYRDQSNNVAAIDAFLSSIESFEAQGKSKELAIVNTTLGKLHRKLEAYPDALQYYLKSLEIRKQLNDSKGLAKIHLELATLSKERENYSEMLVHALKSKQLFEKLERNRDVFSSNIQIALAYDYLNEDEKSKKIYLETLKLIPVYGIENASDLYHNLAILYKKIDQQDSALYYYQKAQKIFIANNDYKRLSKNYNNLGNLYAGMGDFKQSLNNFNKSLALQKTVNDSSLLQKTYWSLANYYEKIGDFKKAYKYKDSSESLREDIFEKIKAADRFALKYVNQKRELELDKNKIEIAKRETEILTEKAVQKSQIITITLIATVLLFFVLMRVRKLKQEKKVTQLAFEQQKIKAQLEKEQQEKKLEEMLQDQERKAITSMITGQEEERERIAKDLHDRLGSMLSVVKIHYKSVEEDLEKIKNETKSQYEKANQLLDEACETVRKIAHNMVSGTLTKFGLIPALKELKQKIEETKILEVELLAHGMDNRLNNSTEIQLYRIIQELLNNILKHADASEVTIQLLKREEDLNIMVSDNGIGFKVDNKEFEGMGLKSIKARVAEMNGQVLIDSSKGNGTTVTIEIPTKK